MTTRQAAYDALPRNADDDLYELADRIHDAVIAEFAAVEQGAGLPPYPGADPRWDARYRAGHLRGWDDAADALVRKLGR